MEEKKTQNLPEEKKESEAISRRSFIRKSAEVAALSLFGVLALDGVMDKVLERIAENRAMGKLSDAAAGALKEHRLDYYANAKGPKGPCFSNYDCSKADGIYCGNFKCPDFDCSPYPSFDCGN